MDSGLREPARTFSHRHHTLPLAAMPASLQHDCLSTPLAGYMHKGWMVSEGGEEKGPGAPVKCRCGD